MYRQSQPPKSRPTQSIDPQDILHSIKKACEKDLIKNPNGVSLLKVERSYNELIEQKYRALGNKDFRAAVNKLIFQKLVVWYTGPGKQGAVFSDLYRVNDALWAASEEDENIESSVTLKENEEDSSSIHQPRAGVGVVRRRRASVGARPTVGVVRRPRAKVSATLKESEDDASLTRHDSMELESNVESNRDSNSMEVDEEQIELREHEVNSSIEASSAALEENDATSTAMEAEENDATSTAMEAEEVDASSTTSEENDASSTTSEENEEDAYVYDSDDASSKGSAEEDDASIALVDDMGVDNNDGAKSDDMSVDNNKGEEVLEDDMSVNDNDEVKTREDHEDVEPLAASTEKKLLRIDYRGLHNLNFGKFTPEVCEQNKAYIKNRRKNSMNKVINDDGDGGVGHRFNSYYNCRVTKDVQLFYEQGFFEEERHYNKAMERATAIDLQNNHIGSDNDDDDDDDMIIVCFVDVVPSLCLFVL